MTEERPTPTLALAALALTLFLYLTAEVFTTGALLPMARSLEVSVSAVGMLVTVYAVVAAAAILPAAKLTTRIPPRRLLTGAMLLLALTQAGIAIAPSLSWVIVLRGISALCHGAVWASAPSVAAALLPGRPGRATASVFLGSALGNVLGAPLVAALSAAASWRLAAAVLALLAAGCGALLARSVPGRLRPERERGGAARPGRRSVLAVARWCALVVLIAAAHLASFTFLAERAAGAGITGGGLAALLLGMGGGGLAGTLLMARLHDARPRASTLGAVAAMTLSLLACGLDVGPVVLGLAVVVWGGAYSALAVALQAFVLRDAPGWGQLASSGYVLFFQVGIASGSGLGAAVLARTGSPAALALVSAALAGGGLVLAAVAMRARAASGGVAHCRHVPPRSRPARDRLPLRFHPVRGRDGRGQP